MPAYDATQFEPPAPLARVTLRNLDTSAVWSEVPMLLDSGADVTLVPQAAVSLLGIAVVPDRRYELISFDGNTSFAPVVRLELVFCARAVLVLAEVLSVHPHFQAVAVLLPPPTRLAELVLLPRVPASAQV